MTSPPLRAATEMIGDRWSVRIIAELQQGPRRFGDLSVDVGGIAPNILSSRLRDLADQRLVVAEPYQQRPVRMSYALSDAGRDLAPVILALEIWGAVHGEGLTDAERTGPWHAACGSPVESAPWCGTCQSHVDHPGQHDSTFF